jgi:hypothetical protein
MKGDPVANLTRRKRATMRTNLNTAMTKIRPPIDILKTITPFDKILNMLRIPNIRISVLRGTTHRIAGTVITDKFLPEWVTPTVCVSYLKQLLARKITSVNMDMKPATTVNAPIKSRRSITHYLNLGKALITLQDRRNELTPRSGTFVNAPPLCITVQIPMIVATGSFQLYPETTLRTNTIKCNGTTTPGLNFPYISTPVTLLTKWVAVPAAHFTTRTRTPTTRTTKKL